MKKIIDFIYSSKTTVLLLAVAALAMAAATFIEEKYDTETAKHLVYNAKWFEVLLLLLVLNFAGSIKKYHLFSRAKASAFVFHTAFIVIIIGAALSRYTGYNGTMHIRQGEAATTMYSNDIYLRAEAEDQAGKYKADVPVHISQLFNSPFHLSLDTRQNGKIEIVYQGIIKNAVDSVEENQPGGISMLGLVIPSQNGRQAVYVNDGEIKDMGQFVVSFNNNSRPDAIRINEKDGQLLITSPFEIDRMAMPAMTKDTIYKDTPAVFREKCLYNLGGSVFVFKKLYKKATKHYVPGPMEGGADALLLNIKVNGQVHQAQILGGSGYISMFQDAGLEGIKLQLAYGQKEFDIPFSLFLNKFNLVRYAGSNSPSSFESDVTLVDDKNNLKEEHRIYMNHVLDYKGYRFFQTSYDQDEQGTVLSVNHDSVGTMVTYAGYCLMGLGFLLSLFNKNSRYYLLRQSIRKIRNKRKSLALFLLFSGIAAISQAQMEVRHVSPEHADKFGHLIVQTVDGRFEPINTLAFDVLHKLAKKDILEVEGVGQMSAIQVFLDMPLNPDFWKKEKIIYVKEKSVQELLGIDGKFASFNDFFDAQGNYKLRDIAEHTFRKKQSEQNAFDKEIIKVDERANVCMMAFNGSMLKIFPLQNSDNNNWISWYDSLAFVPLTGSITILNQDLQLPQFNYNNMMALYFREVYNAAGTGNYSRPAQILGYMGSLQRQCLAAKLLPSPRMVDFEVSYNNAKIFNFLTYVYCYLSLALLVLAFIDVLKQKKSKVVNFLLHLCIGLLVVAFLYHTYGMALRWVITGHAPWSSGYEALLLIAWGGLLAGFFFIRNSKITLAATALLAFFVLMTASISDYDPQLTNLQPVLKSYWLVIHVATLTISYGFLGLGFILGLITMCIYLFKNNENYGRLDMITKELTYINEINLTVGLFLAAAGTFMGGVWANESWGKYWGWDAKETWALIIVITYTLVLHLRFASGIMREYIFTAGSVFGYASVLMCFFGVNYYLSKGLHSYASGDTPVFPVWAWVAIVSIFVLVFAAGRRQNGIKRATSKKAKPTSGDFEV